MKKEIYPNIIKFDKNTIYQIKLPKPIPSVLYDELYQKGIIPKKELEIGKYYWGKCRNANVALWNGDKFTYMRTKFNWCYPEDINHLENDDGFDLFIPLYVTTPNEIQIIKEGHTLKK